MSNRIVSKLERFSAGVLATRTVALRNARPMLSVTFDDFPSSAATMGARILESEDALGTFYLSAGLVGEFEQGQAIASWDEVRSLVAAGHELGCHTFSHVRVGDLKGERLRNDIDRNETEVQRQLPDYRLSSFSYPFGEMDPLSKSMLQSLFSSCRSSQPGVNSGRIDLGALKSERLYSSCCSEARVDELVTHTVKSSGWLILFTHDISFAPPPSGATPELLTYAIKAARRSGLDILPVKNALARAAFG